MTVQTRGGPEVSLGTRNFVAEGGEGKIYALGDTGYKIYHDPAKAIPIGKIQELGRIPDPSVIKPEEAVYGRARNSVPGTPLRKTFSHVGHTFRFIRDAWTLCQLFPRSFREREGFDHKMAVKLVQGIQGGVKAVHSAGILIVDLNEMNFLVSKDFAGAYFTDVDSYQTPQYPATAIMASVRDPLVRGVDFTELSDWFSFAVVSFQVFVGIHPFKGKHPTVKGIEERMRAGISVFDSQVRIPKAAYGFDVIPSAYRDWYEAMFVKGRRDFPPEGVVAQIIVRPVVRRISSGDHFTIEDLNTFSESIRSVFHGGNHVVVHAGNEVFVNLRSVGTWDSAIVVGFTPRSGRPVVAQLDPKTRGLYLTDAGTKKTISTVLRADEIMSCGETIYVRSRDKVLEVILTETGSNVVAGTRLAANVLENASRLFEGVVFQSLLGEPNVSLFPEPGTCYQVMVPELKGHKVVQAKYDGGVLMVLAVEGATYHRYVFRFDERFNKYDVRKVEDVTPAGLNFVTLDSGVCVCLDEEERLELFSNRKGSVSVKTVEDPVLGGDMRLLKHHGQVRFFRGKTLYSMRMK